MKNKNKKKITKNDNNKKKKKSRNRTENKNRKSPKEKSVTGTSCADLLGSPRVSQFPSKYKRKETHSNNKQRNGDPTVYAAPAAAERKEKETTCVCVAFILIGKTQIEKYNPQKMDKNNSNLSFQK